MRASLALVFLSSVLYSSVASAQCEVTLLKPPDGVTRDFSPRFTWSGTADCVDYRILFSTTSDFSANVKKRRRDPATSFKWTASAWDEWALAWDGAVYWKVEGFDAASNSSSSATRYLVIDQDYDDDGVYTSDGDCDDLDALVGASTTWYADADGDGYGDAAVSIDACEAPPGYVADSTDCDDGDNTVGPC